MLTYRLDANVTDGCHRRMYVLTRNLAILPLMTKQLIASFL